MAARGRRREAAERRSPLPDLSWQVGRRAFAPVELLSQDAIEEVHDKALTLLEETGIEFMLPDALRRLEAAGHTVDHDTQIVRFDREGLMEAVSKAPSSFTMKARNPAHDLHIGGDRIVWGSASSAPNVMDLDGGRRPGNEADFQNLVKLNQMLGTCGIICGPPVEPTDLHPSTRHLDMVSDWITLTDKIHRNMTIGTIRAEDGLRMIKIAHGLDDEGLRANPRCSMVLNVNSPLKIDGPLLEGATVMAEAGQCVVVSPVALAGAMSPITLSGSLIQHNAECLAAIAYVQTVRAGAPVFYGSLISNVDMRSGAPALGTPETVTGSIATGQLARRYDIPQRTWLGSTSNTVDVQSAWETMFSLWAAYLSGAHMVYHAHGWMEGGLTSSYEKTIVDSEMISMMNALARPIDLADADEVMTAIAEVGPGGHFFGTPHTMKRYETAFWAPMLADWRAFEFWEADGAVDTTHRANKMWKQLLEAYEKPAFDAGRADELAAFVARRKEEIGTTEI